MAEDKRELRLLFRLPNSSSTGLAPLPVTVVNERTGNRSKVELRIEGGQFKGELITSLRDPSIVGSYSIESGNGRFYSFSYRFGGLQCGKGSCRQDVEIELLPATVPHAQARRKELGVSGGGAVSAVQGKRVSVRVDLSDGGPLDLKPGQKIVILNERLKRETSVLLRGGRDGSLSGSFTMPASNRANVDDWVILAPLRALGSHQPDESAQRYLSFSYVINEKGDVEIDADPTPTERSRFHSINVSENGQ